MSAIAPCVLQHQPSDAVLEVAILTQLSLTGPTLIHVEATSNVLVRALVSITVSCHSHLVGLTVLPTSKSQGSLSYVAVGPFLMGLYLVHFKNKQ